MGDKPLDPKKAIKEILEATERGEKEIQSHLASSEMARWEQEGSEYKRAELEQVINRERKEALRAAQHFLWSIREIAKRAQL